MTEIIQAIIALIAAILSAFAIPWLRRKVGESNMAEFLRWVEIGVAAAEQLYKATDGEKKKAYVVKYLRDKGYEVEPQDIENAIEAAVNRLHNELYGQGVIQSE